MLASVHVRGQRRRKKAGRRKHRQGQSVDMKSSMLRQKTLALELLRELCSAELKSDPRKDRFPFD